MTAIFEILSFLGIPQKKMLWVVTNMMDLMGPFVSGRG